VPFAPSCKTPERYNPKQKQPVPTSILLGFSSKNFARRPVQELAAPIKNPGKQAGVCNLRNPTTTMRKVIIAKA
jgi:hypothetical protein